MGVRVNELGGAAAVLAVVAMSACGATTTPGGGGGTAGCTGSVTVASDLPTGGSDASDGIPTQNGAQLAVDQATAHKLLGGCTITYIPKNDSSVSLGKHDPNQGAANMTELAGNPAVVGVVGPFNSNVGQAEAPIANNADLTLISPSNTNPGLTIPGSNPDINTLSLRPTGKITYFRVCTTDIGQGSALATAAVDDLSAKRAFVIDDQETYGKGLADQFVRFYTKRGGSVAGRASEPGTTRDFREVLTKASQAGATLIFFGGTSSNGGGIVREEMSSILPAAKFLGGDGIVDGEFITEAGAAANGAYGTIAAPDPAKLPSAEQFVKDYTARFGAAPGAYSANAYDAMNIILKAVKEAIDRNGGKLPSDPRALREAVRANVAGISYDGAIGHTSFDKNGDTTNVLVTLDKVVGGKWTFDKTIRNPSA